MTTTDRIVIEGRIARHEQVTVIGEAAVDDMRSFLTRYERTWFPRLPQNTAAIALDRNTGYGMVMVERSPRREVINVQHRVGSRHTDDAGRRPQRWNVMVPWQYFVFGFRFDTAGETLQRPVITSHYLYWSPTQYREDDHQFWPAPCPNIDDYAGICFGGTQNENNETSLDGRINYMVNTFYETAFNEDLGHVTPFGTSLTAWEADSENMLNYVNWAWWQTPTGTQRNIRRSPITLQQIFEHADDGPLPIMQINPAHVDIAPLPENMTVARTIQALNELPEGQRRRIIAAVAHIDDEPLEDGDPAPTVTPTVEEAVNA